jgi:hypothetical protein
VYTRLKKNPRQHLYTARHYIFVRVQLIFLNVSIHSTPTVRMIHDDFFRYFILFFPFLFIIIIILLAACDMKSIKKAS